MADTTPQAFGNLVQKPTPADKAYGHAFSNSASLGFLVPILAKIRAHEDMTKNYPNATEQEYYPKWQKFYEQRLAELRGNEKNLQQANPNSYMGGEMVGAAAPSLVPGAGDVGIAGKAMEGLGAAGKFIGNAIPKVGDAAKTIQDYGQAAVEGAKNIVQPLSRIPVVGPAAKAALQKLIPEVPSILHAGDVSGTQQAVRQVNDTDNPDKKPEAALEGYGIGDLTTDAARTLLGKWKIGKAAAAAGALRDTSQAANDVVGDAAIDAIRKQGVDPQKYIMDRYSNGIMDPNIDHAAIDSAMAKRDLVNKFNNGMWSLSDAADHVFDWGTKTADLGSRGAAAVIGQDVANSSNKPAVPGAIGFQPSVTPSDGSDSVLDFSSGGSSVTPQSQDDSVIVY